MRIAVDTGGTFTDFVVDDGDTITRFKLPSTPNDPAAAVAQGCERFASFELLHGTTVATNSILEGKTARTGLIVNEGFRDILRLGRQTRPELYDWEPRMPKLPIRDEDIRTVSGRINPDGTEEAALVIPDNLGLSHCEAVAVCLLYAYTNSTHERLVEQALGMQHVSCSHRVSPEMREYERLCATALNAAVSPIMTEYLLRLAAISKRTKIMASHGGLVSVEDAASLPIRTVVSGPAGGVAATVALAKRLGKPNVIAFDMGGTSTDVTLIHEFKAAMTSCADIAGLPVRLNRVDVHTVGCGGGSIARIDAAGALRVGPESAGASPGPALYGGPEPTVTDANFALGRLPLTHFAKTSDIDPVKSASIMGELAAQLNLGLQQAAQAVVDVADAEMAAAVRKVSADRGLDPAGFSLVAFGGAGAMHACAVAEILGMREVLVPVGAGVFSALGLLGAPEAWEASRGVLGTTSDWRETYDSITQEAHSHLSSAQYTHRYADMRYQGQAHDLTVPANATRERAEAAFHELHQATFGVSFTDREVQWVTARVRAEGETTDLPVLPSSIRKGEPVDGVIKRECLSDANGPLVVLDDDCTVFIPHGWRAERLEDGTLHLTA
ncbi:MAG: hydantoinase/oxoprolinase family protein [Fimbriimonadales bacterium]